MSLLTFDSNGSHYVTRDLADGEINPYAILSHTWGEDAEEVTFSEIGTPLVLEKEGYKKINFCGEQARQDGWQYFWVDTCCIDKANHVELSKSITSMYRWYQQAQVCYVYLADVSLRVGELDINLGNSWELSFRQSRWFTRGWTLQELLAPRKVVFYTKEWQRLGTKDELKKLIYDITGISMLALEGQSLSRFSINEKLRWARNRQTKQEEDQAYCLLGIFGVYMYLNYGEGDNAFRRLQRKLNAQIDGGISNLHKNPHDIQNDPKSLGLCLASAPYIPPELFVGRADEIGWIHSKLQPDTEPPEQRRVVLGGIGGVGKTQLAIAYARQHCATYTSVLWLNATSKQTVLISLQSIAEQLATTEELLTLDQAQVSRRVRLWLSHPRNIRWLLILDNYDNPDQFEPSDFCPPVSHGSIIITTRVPYEVVGQPLQIEPLAQLDDSLDILEKRSQRENVRHDQGAHALAKRLAGLPIALVTVGAYLRNNDITFQQYLEAYEKSWRVSRRPQILRDYENRTLYNTWDISYVRLQTEDDDAAQMLKLLAYFDPQEMWYGLFQSGLADKPLASLPASLASQIDFGDVMGTLVKYGLVDVHHLTPSYSMYSIHRCVHDWILGELNRDVDVQFYWYAIDCVAGSIKREDRTLLRELQYTRLSRHAEHLTNQRFEECCRLGSGLLSRLDEIIWIARMLKEQVHFLTAEQMYNLALAGCEKHFGPDHALTLATVNDLGDLYRAEGKLPEAEPLYVRALTGRERLLGPFHDLTLDTVHSLGNLYRTQGRLIEAEQMYSRVLAGKEKALDMEHSSTIEMDHTSALDTMHALSDLYRTQGKLMEAEQMYLRVLAGKEETLGADHISTFDTVHALGDLYRSQGKLTQAEQLYVRAIGGKEKALGADHISTLDTVHALGDLCRTQDKLEQAEQMYLRVIAGKEETLGADHISTLDTVHALGDLYFTQDKLTQAEPLYLSVLAGKEKSLGLEHISTLDTIHALGDLYRAQGNLAAAEQLLERALVGKEKLFGPHHTASLDTVHAFGDLYCAQGKPVEAEQAYVRVLTGREAALGVEHFATLDTVTNLGLLYVEHGKVIDGKRMLKQALAGKEKVYGQHHASTQKTKHHLESLHDN